VEPEADEPNRFGMAVLSDFCTVDGFFTVLLRLFLIDLNAFPALLIIPGFGGVV
jgi:hypothetical protein